MEEQGILIDTIPVFWKTWFAKNVVFVKDLLNSSRISLSFREVKEKYNVDTNFLQYCQLISAIPGQLKLKAALHGNMVLDLSLAKNAFALSNNKSIDFDNCSL